MSLLPGSTGERAIYTEGDRDTYRRRWHQYVTPRQRQIVELTHGRGLTSEEVGERLYLSPRTVKAHLANAADRLGVATPRLAWAWSCICGASTGALDDAA